MINEELQPLFRYRYVYYKCVNAGDYKPNKTKKGQKTYTHTRKSNCPASFWLCGRAKEIDMIKLKHNHDLSEDDWKKCKENRRLNETENNEAVFLVSVGPFEIHHSIDSDFKEKYRM